MAVSLWYEGVFIEKMSVRVSSFGLLESRSKSTRQYMTVLHDPFQDSQFARDVCFLLWSTSALPLLGKGVHNG